MFDREAMLPALDAAADALLKGEKSRAYFPYPAGVVIRDFFKEVDQAVQVWAKTRGIEALSSASYDCVAIAFIKLRKSSPMRAKIGKPWHLMEVGDERRIEGMKVSALRCYVSMFAKNMDHLYSVQRHSDTAATVTRIF